MTTHQSSFHHEKSRFHLTFRVILRKWQEQKWGKIVGHLQFPGTIGLVSLSHWLFLVITMSAASAKPMFRLAQWKVGTLWAHQNEEWLSEPGLQGTLKRPLPTHHQFSLTLSLVLQLFPYSYTFTRNIVSHFGKNLLIYYLKIRTYHLSLEILLLLSFLIEISRGIIKECICTYTDRMDIKKCGWFISLLKIKFWNNPHGTTD